jgi:hypothetical protein
MSVDAEKALAAARTEIDKLCDEQLPYVARAALDVAIRAAFEAGRAYEVDRLQAHGRRAIPMPLPPWLPRGKR